MTQILSRSLFALLLAACLTACIVTTASAQAVTILHSFQDGTVAADGADPAAALIQARNGNFYGTTESGGTAGNGTIFKITPSGKVTILHNFADGTVASDGANPYAPLIQGKDGYLYGTTRNGGSGSSPEIQGGSGTVFKIAPDGKGYTIIHDFQAGGDISDGSSPLAALIEARDGYLYGTTAIGGALVSPGREGNGTVFKIAPDGTGYETVHSFGAGAVQPDGNIPNSALLQGRDGDLYGTTAIGGSGGEGTIYKITPLGAETILHTFGDGTVVNDGAEPDASLVQVKDGTLYGTTTILGSADHGTLFKIAPDGTGYATVHDFGDGTVTDDGLQPRAPLIRGGDGILYGTTDIGGSGGVGTVYKIAADGTGYAVVYDFGGAVSGDGSQPQAALVKGDDGDFYGTTTQGGSAGDGTVFRLSFARPVVTSFAPDARRAGAVVTIFGRNLSGVTSVQFRDAKATDFAVNVEGTKITVTVPPEALSGHIIITTPTGAARTSYFTVIAPGRESATLFSPM